MRSGDDALQVADTDSAPDQIVDAHDAVAKLMEAPRWNQGLLEELSVAMADASICGLGQAAPNPIRCVVKYFPQEVE